MDQPSLRVSPQQPVSFNATPSDLLTEAKALNAESTAVIESIVASAKSSAPTFENTIEPFIQRENKRITRFCPIQFYASTSTNKSVREASDAAIKILEEHNLDLFHNRELFAIVHAVWEDRGRLDAAAKHYMEKLHSDFEEKGCAIDDPSKRARFQVIQKRLGDLRRELAMNINSDTSGLWFRGTDLAGLPEDALLRFRRAAERQVRAKSLPQTDTDEQMCWVSMKEPDRIAVCSHAKSQWTRRLVSHTYANRLPERIPMYREVFMLRDEAARIMGFRNHATFRMKYKMLGSVEPVESFLKQVCEQLQKSRDETLRKMMEIQAQDAKDEDVSDPKLGLTEGDTLYYGRRLQEKMCSLEEKVIAEYFPLETTLIGLFDIFKHIFGVEISKVEAQEHQLLHPTIQMYTLWDDDKSQDFLGYLYLDLFPRDGKFTHAGTYPLVPGFTDKYGERHYPSSALVMNLTPPVPHKPSLLTHHELRRVFHELGHCMHNLLSKTRYARFHGTYVDPDFLEGPSMMFEHFLWTPEGMRNVSHHYSRLSPEYHATWEAEQHARGASLISKPQRIPDDLIRGIVASRNVNRSLTELRKAWMATFDMRIHSPATHGELEEMDISKLWYDLRTEIMGYEDLDVEGGSGLGYGWSSFRAIMGKYSAGYYTYLLAQVYACDLFYTGFKGDIMNPERGRRYRYGVLEPGGSRPELETLRAFLGRDPNTKAFCEEQGISLN